MYENLLRVNNGRIVTTSVLVAEKFNKSHKAIVQKIESLINEIQLNLRLNQPNFFEKSSHVDEWGHTRTMYFVSRVGLLVLTSGFTGAEALQWKIMYLAAFNTMEKTITSDTDNRLEIARIVATASDDKLEYIRDLYPEYFSRTSSIGSLEYRSNVNSGYQKWIEDMKINTEWIHSFPTTDVFLVYMNYCKDYNFPWMGKRNFYKTLENDFRLSKRQKADRYQHLAQ